MERKPYRQGHLDGFCGVYSVVNSMRLINRRMGDEKATMLFKRILRCLERKGAISSFATYGLSTDDLLCILKEVVIPKYRIAVTRPFYRSRNTSLDYFLWEVTEYLRECPGRAVITSVAGHWTVLQGATAKQIHFFDSTGTRKVTREKCTIARVSSPRPYLIEKKDVFFLTKKDKRERR
jgi:hypothetical protein